MQSYDVIEALETEMRSIAGSRPADRSEPKLYKGPHFKPS